MDWKSIREQLLKLPNVIGLSERLQYKIVKGKTTDILSIRVYVSQKVSLASLKPEHVIPPVIESVKTDVITQLGEFKIPLLLPIPKSHLWKQTGRTIKHRPLFAGISTGHPCITAGTLGQPAIHDRGKGYISNWHIYRYTCGFINDFILQQAKYDGGKEPDDYFGQVIISPDVVPEGYGVNKIDGGFALVSKLEDWTPDIARHNVAEKFQAKGEAECTQGQKVFFTGRTTEYGEGICIDDMATIRCNYGSFNAILEEQCLDQLSPNIQGGNSGSPRYELGTDKFLGEYYAGSPTSAVACKWIPHLKEILELTLPTEPEPPPDEWLKVYEDWDTRLYKRPKPSENVVFEDSIDKLVRK